jgi:hypothetical protein
MLTPGRYTSRASSHCNHALAAILALTYIYFQWQLALGWLEPVRKALCKHANKHRMQARRHSASGGHAAIPRGGCKHQCWDRTIGAWEVRSEVLARRYCNRAHSRAHSNGHRSMGWDKMGPRCSGLNHAPKCDARACVRHKNVKVTQIRAHEHMQKRTHH